MSYELKKPITDTQKADFIVEYNHNQGLRIEDTEMYLFALEPNEMMGEKEIDIEVPEYETIIDEDGNEHQVPIMIEYEDTEVVIDYDEEGNPIGSHEITVIKHKQQTHKETITVQKPVPNPNWELIQLNKAKENMKKANDIERDTALNAGVLYKDILFDSDTDQKVNLLATVALLDDETIITWFGMNNQPLECTKADLINIGGLIAELHTFCWTKNAEIKAAINAAENLQNLIDIDINYSRIEQET